MERTKKQAPQIKKDIFDFVYVCRNDQMMPDLEASHRIYRMILTLLSGITNTQTGTPLSARFFFKILKSTKKALIRLNQGFYNGCGGRI